MANRATKQKPKRQVVEGKKTSRNSRGPLINVGEYGARYTPATNPPDTTSQPWWSLVISSIRKPGDYTFTELVKDFLKQVGTGYTFNSTTFDQDSGTPFRFCVRIERVVVWNLTGRIVSLSVWDVEERSNASDTTTQTDLLGGWVDCGGASCFPAIGFRYPSSHHRRVYRPDPRYASVKIVTTTGGSSDSILHHIHIQWRADGVSKFTTVKSEVEEITNTVQEQVGLLKDAIDEKEGPSLAKRTVANLGVIAANYVIPLTLEEPAILGSAAHIANIVANSSSTPIEKDSVQSPDLRSLAESLGSYDDCA